MMMLVPALVAALAASPVVQDDAKRIEKLVEDLGAEEYAVREAADRELRKIGAPAEPFLRKAVEGGDAERADRARKILDAIEKDRSRAKDPAAPPGSPGLKFASTFVFRDLTLGLTFKQEADGRVEVTVPEDDPASKRKVYKTYTAPSFEEFKKLHPAIVEKYGLEQRLPKVAGPGELEDWWKDRRKGFGVPGEPPDPFDEEAWKKWIEDQLKVLEGLRDRRPMPRDGERPDTPTPPGRPAEPKAPEFGIVIGPVNETLRAQLDLPEGGGAQVNEVKAGSLAERSGIKTHDLILGLNGTPVTDLWDFRTALRAALASPSFELEILRNGKREKVTVKP